jgi:signal transduction histidine kinase
VRVGVDITAVRDAEQALQQSETRLLQSETQLRALTAGLLKAQEEERKRISQEIHDDIGQRLVALAIQAEVLHQALGVSPEDIRLKLRRFQEQLEVLSGDLRRTARDLHPFTLTHLGLEAALRSYCQEFSELRQIKVRLVWRAVPETLSPDIALCVYRVVQEALGNAARHSAASRVLLAVGGRKEALNVAIRDNGVGFDPDQARGKGLGLISMEERVRQVGGTFSIRPRPGRGTRIEIRIPFENGQPPLGESRDS